MANDYSVWPAEGASRGTHQPPWLRGAEPLSLSLGRYYTAQLQRRALAQQSDELRQQLIQARKREESQLNEQINRLKATEQAPELQQQADALFCLQSPNRDEIAQAQNS